MSLSDSGHCIRGPGGQSGRVEGDRRSLRSPVGLATAAKLAQTATHRHQHDPVGVSVRALPSFEEPDGPGNHGGGDPLHPPTSLCRPLRLDHPQPEG
ncbi:hypothetical protein CEXT_243711 [Caerostris extrusa]|uniref:Uncharacterized protein n=1 Tax=Caerostris extrusa TaxID=172846 RepID=A0AAV4VI11_CAEEX|nr:hypothetical protein CEXT_243711 [Caerostris extrusa]